MGPSGVESPSRGEEIVVAPTAIIREKGTMHLLGYSAGVEGWIVVGKWDEVDIEHDEFYNRLDEWVEELFADWPGFCVR